MKPYLNQTIAGLNMTEADEDRAKGFNLLSQSLLTSTKSQSVLK